MTKKGSKFSNATAVTPNSRAPVTLEILYGRGEVLHNLIESKMGAIEVLRSELNQVFDRLDTLEDKVEEMQAAVKDDSGKEKVAILESKVRELQEAVTKNPLKTKVAELELKLTNINSAMRKPMRDGRDFSNPKTLIRKSCAVCSETFLKNADLEKHMTEHDAPRDFECTVCAKKFFLEWRMKKHTQMHTVIPRTCRYFSTKMPCPFEEIGCKFSHTTLLQPATYHVDVHGHAEQPQHHHAVAHGQGEQPQLHHAVPHGHGEQPQLHRAVPHGHGEQPQLHRAAIHSLDPRM